MTRTFLHAGCGESRFLPWVFAGWQEVRLDIDPSVAPDIVASITDLSQLPDASFDAVFSHHNLEHLEAWQVPLALGEFRRVLRPTGWLLLEVPDLQHIAEWVAQDRLEDRAYDCAAGPVAPIDMIFGHRGLIAEGNHFMAHRTGFTARTLQSALEKAGFLRGVVKRHAFTLSAYGIPAAEAELPHPDPIIAHESVAAVANSLRPVVAEHGRGCLPPAMLAVLEAAEREERRAI